MKKKNPWKIKTYIYVGFALFSMLFGAGNIIFPLYLGANIENHVSIAILGFLITGVGAPFLGLFATSLFKGNYWIFFSRLGKVPAFIIITFLIIIIGPLIAIPRTEIIVWSNLMPYLPKFLNNHYIFSFIYCFLLFILNIKDAKIIDILGLLFSPIKIITFFSLIIIGILYSEQNETHKINQILNKDIIEVFNKSMIIGYSTMDMLATFFFTTIAFKAIKNNNNNDNSYNINTTIKSSIIGAVLIGITYAGFIYLSYKYKKELYNIPIENTLASISQILLGSFGELFVCLCLSFSCFATALALIQVSKTYLYKELFKKKISKFICLNIIISITFIMSHVKFQTLMILILPVLEIFYPVLIVICIMNILYKLKNIKTIKTPVLITFITSITISYIY